MPPAKPKTLAKARAQLLAAAKRSLSLTAEDVAKHDATLKRQEIPDGSFLASAQKYDQALVMIRLLDSLSDGTDEAYSNGTVVVQAEDLAALVLFAHGFVEPVAREDGSPIARLTEAAFPDGIPAEPDPGEPQQGTS